MKNTWIILTLLFFIITNIVNANDKDAIKEAFESGLITKQLYETISGKKLVDKSKIEIENYFKMKHPEMRVNPSKLIEIEKKRKKTLKRKKQMKKELFLEGLDLHKDREYDKAINILKKFLGKYSSDRRCSDVQFLLASCYEEVKLYKNAILEYDKAKTLYVTSDIASIAFLRIAICYDKIQDYDNALTSYETFIKKYPSNLLKRFATDRFEYLMRVYKGVK